MCAQKNISTCLYLFLWSFWLCVCARVYGYKHSGNSSPAHCSSHSQTEEQYKSIRYYIYIYRRSTDITAVNQSLLCCWDLIKLNVNVSPTEYAVVYAKKPNKNMNCELYVDNAAYVKMICVWIMLVLFTLLLYFSFGVFYKKRFCFVFICIYMVFILYYMHIVSICYIFCYICIVLSLWEELPAVCSP